MSGVTIRVDLAAGPAREPFAALRAVTDDLRPVLDDIGAELESSTVLRFETNIAPDGTAWPQSLHSKVTGKPTLVDEGHLRDSVHYVVEAEAVEVGAGGIAAAYAAIHQVGGVISAKGEALHFRLATGEFITAKSVTMPARPYLGISADDEKAIGEIVADHWRAAMGGGLG